MASCPTITVSHLRLVNTEQCRFFLFMQVKSCAPCSLPLTLEYSCSVFIIMFTEVGTSMFIMHHYTNATMPFITQFMQIIGHYESMQFPWHYYTVTHVAFSWWHSTTVCPQVFSIRTVHSSLGQSPLLVHWITSRYLQPLDDHLAI